MWMMMKMMVTTYIDSCWKNCSNDNDKDDYCYYFYIILLLLLILFLEGHLIAIMLFEFEKCLRLFAVALLLDASNDLKRPM
jgi:hypothetical protein